MNGLGVNLFLLSGGSKESASKYYGKTIKDMELDKDKSIFKINFTDGLSVKITDEGQSCCESRYITCDDDLKKLNGEKLVDITVSYSDSKSDSDYGDHEIATVKIQSDKDAVTFCTHNEHNGYYGGFGLSIDEVEQ